MLVSPITTEVPHRPARRCGAGMTVRRSRWRANRQLSRVRAQAIHADTHQSTPPLFFRYPWTLPDGFTRSWIERGAGAFTEQPISMRRPGPERGQADRRGWTAVDTRGTRRTQSAESTAVGRGSEQKKASGHRRRRSPKNRRARAGSTVPRPEHSGAFRKAKWGSGAFAPGPPPARLPPRALRNDGLY